MAWMRVPTKQGVVEMYIEDEDQRKAISDLSQAISGFLRKGNREPLKNFGGATVEGETRVTVELEADPELIKQWDASGELDYEDLYVVE